MKRSLHALRIVVLILTVNMIFVKSFAQTETIPAGSFIINMGVTPQTINNGVRPYGLIWDIIKNNKAQVRWVISQTKLKDGIDFTYNGVDYKGGTFIIPQKYISTAVAAKINAVYPSIIVGTYTTAPITVSVTYNLKYTPRWTFDFQNGSIALGYLDNAMIPTASYPKKLPQDLNDCDDLFVMPHADPTWATHKNLKAWNLSSRGWIWAGCHAVSALENLYNPADSSDQMNFLCQNFDGWGSDHSSSNGFTGNSLVLWNNHSNANTPYTYYYPNDPEMQFVGSADAGVGANGSERAFMPYNPTSAGGAGRTASWRPSTKIAISDNSPAATNPNVPENTNGPVVEVAYGRAFGDMARGEILYEAGHSHDGSSPDFVAAQRIFFNFSFLAVNDKDPLVVASGPSSLSAGSSGTFSVSLQLPGANLNNYYIDWSSSCGGTFSNKHGSTTSYTPASIGTCGPCVLMVTLTDGCGREFYSTFDLTVNVCPAPPVALDRTNPVINNVPGTGPQPVAAITPPAGTDIDGVVVSYTLTSLPSASQGVLYYDNDNNTATPDIVVPVNTALTAAQATSIKFDPADNYGGNVTFNYTVTDNSGLTDATPAVFTIPVNPPPVAQNIITAPMSSVAQNALLSPGLNATDDGTIVSYTITVLPLASQGVLSLYGIPITAGQTIKPAQASQLRFTPTGNYIGYPTFTYSATDDKNASDSTPATVTIQLMNQTPKAKSISNAMISTSATGAIGILDPVADDVDGSITSYKILSLPSAKEGVLYYKNGNNWDEITKPMTFTAVPNLKFDPTDGYTGVSSFKYTVTDNNSLVDNTPAIFTIPIGVAPPIATDKTNSSVYSGAGQTAILALAGTTPDPSHPIVSYTVQTLPDATQGVLYYNPGAGSIPVPAGTVLTPSMITTLKFDPSDGATGNAMFEYTVTDNAGYSDLSPAVFTIPISNTAPVAANKTNTSISSSAGAANILAMAATDADGTVSSYMLTDLPDPTMGIVLLNGSPLAAFQLITPVQAASLQFSPVAGASGNAVFHYTAIDDQLTADATPATFTVPLTFTNVKPIADNKTNPSFPVNADAAMILPFTGSDADGTVISYKVKSIPPAAKGTLYLNGVPVAKNQVIPANLANRISFKPSGTSAGDASFTYSAFDDLNTESNADADYVIAVTNAAPEAASLTIPAIKKNTTVNIPTLAGTDADGTIASYKITGLATMGLLYVDLTGAGTTYSLVTLNQNLTPAQAGRLRIAPGNTNGTSTFTYTATDNLGLAGAAATYTLPITDNAAKQLPIAADKINAAINASAAATSIMSLSGSDVDGTIIGYVIRTIPPPYAGTLYYMQGGSTLTAVKLGGTFITPTEAATLSYDPSGNYIGNVKFTYTSKDDDYLESATVATVTIPIINTAPTATNITNSSLSSDAGPTGISTLAGTDADGTISTFIIMTLPGTDEGLLYLDGIPVSAGQVMTPAQAARLQFDPLPTFIGNSKFTYTVTDNLDVNASTAATFTIPVINQAPITEDKVSQVMTNPVGTGAFAIPAFTGIDYDGTVSSFIIKSLPNGGTLYVNGNPATVNQTVTTNQANQLTFDPNDGYSGITAFTYTAKDNTTATDATPASYQIAVNIPPTSNNVNISALYAGAPNTAIQPLSGSDDGSVQQYRITDLPSSSEGTLYINNTPVTDISQVAVLTTTQISQLSYASSSTFSGATLNYTDFDNLGLVDVTPSVYDIPQKIIISGNVWNDVDGSKDIETGESLINGTNTGGGVLTGNTMYVNLVNDAGIVLASGPVQSNGSYSFPAVVPNSKVTLQLTNNQGSVNAAKPATVLPSGWATTGENTNGAGLPDILPNSEIILTANNSNVLTQNFGIEKLPESAFSTHAGTNPGVYNNATVDPIYFVTNNVGSTPNTQDYHAGTVNAIRITAFPTNVNTITINGTRYINGGTCPVTGTCTTWPAGGVTVPFANGAGPTQAILVDPLDAAGTVRIPYAAIDNAGKEDPTPGYAEIIYTFSVVAVKVESFNAAPKDNNVVLTWTVSQETGIDHYEPEFSTNGTNFTKIGSAANTGSHNYSMLHTSPVQGVNYYRLRIKELDGSTSLSDIKKVIFNKTGSVNVFPNPARDVANINFVGFMLDKGSTVRILSTDGKVLIVKEITSTNTYETVDISRLAAGTYIIQIESEGIISSKPLIKQ